MRRLSIAGLACSLALAACGGDEEAAGGTFAERADAVCSEHADRMRELQVEHLEGATVPEDRLAAFWDAYLAEYDAQLGALRDLGGAPARAADYVAQLERNLEGLRGVAGAVGEGSSKPLGTIVHNSERTASELAETAGLTRCSPAEQVRFTAYAAGLTAGG